MSHPRPTPPRPPRPAAHPTRSGRRAGRSYLAGLLLLLLLLSCQSASSGGGSPSDGGGGDGGGPSGPLRSTLYPLSWQPGFADAQGRFLNDFSYAGYKNGEQPLPTTVPGLVYDVVAKYGADPTGASDATAAIQAALNAAAAAGGGVVFLPAGSFRCDGLLDVSKSGVVLRGAGPDQSFLYFTKFAGMSDLAHLTMHGTVVAGANLPLASDATSQSVVVSVADASSLAVGDDVSIGWTITPAFVAEHNMTGTWTVFLNQWKPFFRRRVVAIDRTKSPQQVTVDVPLRYPAKLRDQAALRRETGYLSGCGIESLSIANAVAWADAWKSQRTHAIALNAVKDCWIRNVHSFAPPTAGAMTYHLQNGGLVVKDSKRVTVADSQLENAQNRGDGGCGYLYEVSTSSEVLVRDSVAKNGRHNFIQNWDFGTTGLVFLRCHSEGSQSIYSVDLPIAFPTASEYHHSLTMACLVDSPTILDSWAAVNRGLESSGAGITATQNVFWHSQGGGGNNPLTSSIRSYQYGYGYVIGTQKLSVQTALTDTAAAGTAPEDFVELFDRGQDLDPPSLYDDQLRRRSERGERLW